MELEHQAMAHRHHKKVVQVLSNVLNSSSKHLASWPHEKGKGPQASLSLKMTRFSTSRHIVGQSEPSVYPNFKLHISCSMHR